MEIFLKDLNSAQYEAVVNTEGPSLVIAGAGSGKTRVLTYRVAYLINKGVNPSNLLCLTFTNKAAREMKERIALLVGEKNSKMLWMGTFHSIFSKILRIEAESLGYNPGYTIYDTLDSKSLLKSIIGEMKLNDQLYKPSEVLGRISWAKNNLITPQGYSSNPQLTVIDSGSRRPEISEIYKTYCIRCKKSGAMDFDDLLLNTNILFRDFPEILKKYQEKFHYILVDEYQDTNYSQYLIVKRLSESGRNLCVVGDDAQSIYSFRGARIENILNFKSDYPEYKIYKLEQNYRSTRTIVNAANSLIARNQGQIKKTIWSDNESGTPVQVVRNISDIEEGFFVANNILDSSLSEQRQFSDYAILYRTNAQSRIFEEALRKRNIPYRVYGGVSFYQRKEIKDMLAYLRMTVNRHDNEALRRIINYPARGIGDVTFNKIESWSVNRGISIWETLEQLDSANIDINKGTMAKLNGFVSLINSFPGSSNNENAYEAACTIASASGIKKDLLDSHTPEEKSRIENIDELLNGIKEYVEAAISENMPYNLASYLENISLLTDLDLDKDGDRNHVTIMTIHSAKGLEFSVVYIGGVEDELFPNRQACESQEELEEERRLFYVALTRAKKKVYISYCENRFRYGTPIICHPSRFINDIDPSFVNLPGELRKNGNGKPFTHSRQNDTEYSYNSVKPSARPEAAAPGNTTGRRPLPAKSYGRITQKEGFVPDNPDTIREGMQVEHSLFGTGRVISVEGTHPDRKAKVFFNEIAEEKNLLLKFAKLRIIEE